MSEEPTRELIAKWRADHEQFVDLTKQLFDAARPAIGDTKCDAAKEVADDYSIRTHDLTKLVEQAVVVCEAAKTQRRIMSSTLRDLLTHIEAVMPAEDLRRPMVVNARRLLYELESQQ